MKPFVGVLNWSQIFFKTWASSGLMYLPPSLRIKQEALLFDQIALNNIDYRYFKGFDDTPLRRDLDWLEEQGIVIRHELSLNNASLPRSLLQNEEHAHWLQTFFQTPIPEPEEYIIDGKRGLAYDLNPVFVKTELLTRLTSVELCLTKNLDAHPVIHVPFTKPNQLVVKETEVIEIVLDQLPVPDDETPWEMIIEYRDDPDSKRKYAAIRTWMGEVARMQLEPNEVEAKLHSLISDYEEHMKLHKIKSRLEALKTIVVTEAGFMTSGWLSGLGVLPGVAGMVIAPIYSLKQRKVALLEQEQKAPGREVAYIPKARARF